MALSAIPKWRDMMVAEQPVEDEFTCPGVLQGSLLTLKPTVERVFVVTLRIGGEDDSYASQDGQIWLQLRGRKQDVEAAKLFIKGIVNQEAQKEVQYPHVLHCVFCGARGLFLDCLVRSTSAHIVVGSVGCLLISGLVEPVVKAYSLIIDLVEKYNSSQTQPPTAESEIDSRRAFKSLLEKLEDSHTLELLVLPVMIKEVLLYLVKQSGVEPNTLDSGVISTGPTNSPNLQERMERLILKSGENQNYDILKTATISPRANGTPQFSSHSFHPLIAPGSASADVKKQERKCDGASHNIVKEGPSNQEEQPGENLLSTASKQENEHLLKFFTAMGFNDEVVCRILTRTGPREPSEVLDLIQQEQDKAVIPILKQEVSGALGGKDEDFVLGVMKKAAASCGYTEEKVTEIYSNLPELKPHELLLELQRKGMREQSGRKDGDIKKAEETEVQWRKTNTIQGVKESPVKEKKKNDILQGKTEMKKLETTNNDRKVRLEGMDITKKDMQAPGRERSIIKKKTPENLSDPDLASTKPDIVSSSRNQLPFHIIPPSVCGPPQPTYYSSLSTNSSEEKNAPVEPTFPRPKHKPQPSKSGSVITGHQRYLEGLQTPFVLQLKDDHGDPGLRQIIIDGSNVAMTHGLGIFFSCRGIALAVEYFWNQGHRKITALVPQWRQRKDPKIKEQHFMTQLQDLGLLSFTPSREFKGQRINSYDDRFMLHLARQTDGVIVTNDNMRDLVDESVGWKEIIKTRLLQYVFAGDLFMVPDDPLGRSGPHIKDFLRLQNRLPISASHTFAGLASNSPQASAQTRSQTEVLNYRERTPVGAHRLVSGHSQGKNEMGRSAQETLRLKQDLVQIFPGQDSVITMTLQCYPALDDINQLSYFILEQINSDDE